MFWVNASSSSLLSSSLDSHSSILIFAVLVACNIRLEREKCEKYALIWRVIARIVVTDLYLYHPCRLQVGRFVKMREKRAYPDPKQFALAKNGDLPFLFPLSLPPLSFPSSLSIHTGFGLHFSLPFLPFFFLGFGVGLAGATFTSGTSCVSHCERMDAIQIWQSYQVTTLTLWNWLWCGCKSERERKMNETSEWEFSRSYDRGILDFRISFFEELTFWSCLGGGLWSCLWSGLWSWFRSGCKTKKERETNVASCCNESEILNQKLARKTWIYDDSRGTVGLEVATAIAGEKEEEPQIECRTRYTKQEVSNRSCKKVGGTSRMDCPNKTCFHTTHRPCLCPFLFQTSSTCPFLFKTSSTCRLLLNTS